MFRNRYTFLSARRHFPVEPHLNPRRYRFVLITLNFSPVVSDATEKRSRNYSYILTVSIVGDLGEGGIWMIVESSTKQYPLVAKIREKYSI